MAITPTQKFHITSCKNMLKGRVAEVAVEELFKYLGYEVYRHGIEATIPSIMRNIKDFRNNKIFQDLRAMPDFIITKQNEAHEIEVKYRENGHYSFDELMDRYPNYPHIHAIFVIVSPEGIKGIYYKDLVKKSIKPGSEHYLAALPEFQQYEEKIRYYCGFVKSIYRDGLLNWRAPVAEGAGEDTTV